MTTTPRVALVGTLDTKGAEYHWMADRLSDLGVDVVVVDTGIRAPSAFTDDVSVGRERVAEAAGTDIDTLVDGNDRGAAVTAMGEGAAVVLADLASRGELDGVLALGGSGGSSIAARAVRDLPIGLPKLIVSTMASGDVSPYVGASDVTMMYSVVDIAGINRLSRSVLGNAAGAIAGMAREHVGRRSEAADRRAPVRRRLDVRRHDAGGRRRPRAPRRAGLRDARLPRHRVRAAGRWRRWRGPGCSPASSTSPRPSSPTTSSVASSAPGPDRLTAAGATGVPQVVSLGALDMVNFGPRGHRARRVRGPAVLRAQPAR